MPIEPVKIPQNVYIEDHIVGPLTLHQTLMMAIGGAISYMIYGVVSKAAGVNIVVTAMAWIPFLIATVFALVKINDLSLTRICLLSLERLNKSPVRVWTPRRGLTITIRTASLSNQSAKAQPEAPQNQTQQKIKELSSIIDRGIMTQPTPLETPVAEPAIAITSVTKHTAQENISDDLDSSEDTTPLPLPVNPSRVKVDQPTFSDLSVFRDIFPQS